MLDDDATIWQLVNGAPLMDIDVDAIHARSHRRLLEQGYAGCRPREAVTGWQCVAWMSAGLGLLVGFVCGVLLGW